MNAFSSTPEAEAPSISVAGQNIHLQWQLPGGCFEVKVVRKEGDAPRHHADGQVVPAQLTEAHDRALRPDVLYCYRICVGLGGGAWSAGVVVQARTQVEASVAGGDIGLMAHDFGHYLALQWRWPANGDSFLVSWRRDGHFPAGPDDSRAGHMMVSRSDYMRRGGFRIERPDHGAPWHFTVRAVMGETLTKTYGAALEAALRTDRRVTLWYDVQRRPFRDAYDLRLWSEVDVPLLPQVVLAATPGRLAPAALDPARIVATATRDSLVAGQRSIVGHFALGQQRRPFVLRAFCGEPGQAAGFLLAPHAPQRLVFD